MLSLGYNLERAKVYYINRCHQLLLRWCLFFTFTDSSSRQDKISKEKKILGPFNSYVSSIHWCKPSIDCFNITGLEPKNVSYYSPSQWHFKKMSPQFQTLFKTFFLIWFIGVLNSWRRAFLPGTIRSIQLNLMSYLLPFFGCSCQKKKKKNLKAKKVVPTLVWIIIIIKKSCCYKVRTKKNMAVIWETYWYSCLCFHMWSEP